MSFVNYGHQEDYEVNLDPTDGQNYIVIRTGAQYVTNSYAFILFILCIYTERCINNFFEHDKDNDNDNGFGMAMTMTMTKTMTMTMTMTIALVWQ